MKKLKKTLTHGEVLDNWFPTIDTLKKQDSSTHINFDDNLNLIYSGNLGLSQENNILKDFIRTSKLFKISITFIGKGKIFEKERLFCKRNKIENIKFINSLNIKKLISFFSKFDYGIFSLNENHVSGHVPGKYLAYIHNGLPVIGFINKKNPLNEEIKKNNLGLTFNSDNNISIKKICEKIILCKNSFSKENSINFAKSKYSVEMAYSKIIGKLNENN